MAVTANRFQTSQTGCVKAQRGEDALFCNIDFTLSCRLRCSVGSNRSGPRKQIQRSRERLRASNLRHTRNKIPEIVFFVTEVTLPAPLNLPIDYGVNFIEGKMIRFISLFLGVAILGCFSF